MTARDRPPISSYRLPRGRHRLPRELVAENHRWRLIGAAAEVMAESGYAGATSKAVARRAGVSAGTFYEHFDDLDACLLATCEMAADSLSDLAAAACTGGGEWPQRLRAAVEAALEYAASEPAFSGLLGFEASGGVAAIATARERLLLRLAGLLCAGRELRLETAGELPPRLELHLLAGAFSVVSARLAEGEVERLASFGGELTEILALPYRRSAVGARR